MLPAVTTKHCPFKRCQSLWRWHLASSLQLCSDWADGFHVACPECVDALQVTDPSLLRFLVDLRDADLSDKQLRDDLMTMLIAGHETTAAVLTWTLFALMSNPEVEAKMLDEIDSVLGDKTPGAACPCRQ